MKTTTKGLVIKEKTVGESDKLITILTEDFGLVRAFVRKGRSVKNPNVSATSLFAYGEFVLYRTKTAYIVEKTDPIEYFFDLRQSIEALSLAQYFAQLAYYLASEEQPAPELLRLILNALHFLCKKNKDHTLLKAIVELRAMSLGGFMPNILACYRCGTYESDIMYFDVEEGCIYCKDCYRNNAITAPIGVISAIRCICLSDLNKVFSFDISDENKEILATITEKYMLSRIDAKLTTLEFYKAIT